MWTPVHTIKPVIKTEGTVVKIGGEDADTPLPSDAVQLRIVFNKETNGSLYLDDVVLAHDASFKPVYHTGYEKHDAQNHTDILVEGLQPSTRYHYVVFAYDYAGTRSLPSNEIEMTTSDSASIESADIETGLVVGTGYVSATGTQDSLFSVTTTDGVRAHSSCLDGGCPVTVYLPVGIYIVSVNGRAHKVAVR